MPGGSKQSRFMQRCVADVTGQGKELGSAFAICTAQSQKAGYSESGSRKQTGKGKAREKQFKKQPDMGTKAGAYERAVQAGRKSESMADVFARIEESVDLSFDDAVEDLFDIASDRGGVLTRAEIGRELMEIGKNSASYMKRVLDALKKLGVRIAG